MSARPAVRHWAFMLIGSPWRRPNGCWVLVQQCVRLRYDEELPDIEIGSESEQSNAIRAVVSKGWRRSQLPEQEGDIVVGWGGRHRHAGFMIETNRRKLLLHSDEFMTGGAAVLQPLGEAMQFGFTGIEVWRRHAR